MLALTEDDKPFDDTEVDILEKRFYIPKAVYTNIKNNKYKTQKNLSLKTYEGLENPNNYYMVRLEVIIPNDKIVLDPNELYKILTNCGINTETAKTAITAAMENNDG